MFGEITSNWWLFLITGIAWVIIALVVLRFDTTSLATVGALLGVVFLLIAAIAAFATPYGAFWALASILGFLLVLKGSLDIIASAMTKDVNELWVLGLLTGILELILGFWASHGFFPARAALILIWVGFMALFRGVSEIVLAFQIRRLHATAT